MESKAGCFFRAHIAIQQTTKEMELEHPPGPNIEVWRNHECIAG